MEEWVSRIQAGLRGWLCPAATPGAAVALVERGRPAAFVCAGVRDVRNRKPITPDTIFEAASLSKPVFAWAVLQLAAEGGPDLDAALHGLLPQDLIPGEPRLERLTARQVLSHSSGLPNWLDKVSDRALLFAPGEDFGYSGEGYVYLQRVVEKVSGMDLERLTRSRVLQPLGMMRSSFRYPSHSLAEMTQGHDPKGAPRSERPPLDDNAGASLYSTLADYAGFLSGVIDGGAGLPKQWRETMMVPQTMIDAETAWGLGWGLKQIRDERIFWQWGDNTGFKHIAAGSLEQARAVCVLTNGERGYEVWRRVLHLTLDPDGAIFEWASRL